MGKDRFTVNPFSQLMLTPGDTADLEELAQTIVDANLQRYESFRTVDHGKPDPQQWKLVKARENAYVYSERPQQGVSRSTMPTMQKQGLFEDLPSLLCVGTSIGTLEDVMFGVVSPTLEVMRIKASYVNDISGAAVLATIAEPTLEDPFKSVVVKWMELDIPLHSTTLVKNRDYVYVETTGVTELSDGEKVGYHVLHSVNFPQTHALPGRVRANLSICGFFRQTRSNAVEIYVMGLMDSAGDHMKRLLVPSMASAFLSTLKYAHCGQMKKLAWALERRYAKSKNLGTPKTDRTCVTCARTASTRRSVRMVADFGKSSNTCKLCFGHVCSSCKLYKKLSFVTADLLLSSRKVTFCALCVNDAMAESAVSAARAQIIDARPGITRMRQRSVDAMASRTTLESSACQVSYEFILV